MSMDNYVEINVIFGDGTQVKVMADGITNAVRRAAQLARELEKVDICTRIERA